MGLIEFCKSVNCEWPGQTDKCCRHCRAYQYDMFLTRNDAFDEHVPMSVKDIKKQFRRRVGGKKSHETISMTVARFAIVCESAAYYAEKAEKLREVVFLMRNIKKRQSFFNDLLNRWRGSDE